MSERIHFIDNLKGILIFLVVVGHFLLNARGEAETTRLLFQSIYLFHMPLFVFVSGFLSKRVYTKDRGLRANKILSLIVLGFIFQTVIICFNPGPDGIIPFLKTLNFGSTPWYLISLATWYLLTPVLSRAKPLPCIIVSIILGLLSGCVDVLGNTLSIARTFTFLPFFVIGYYCSTDKLKRAASSKYAKVMAIAAVLFIICYWVYDGTFLSRQYPLVYGNVPYSGSMLQGLLDRSILYIVAGWLSIALMSIVPKREIRWLAYLGKNTLSIFVFHRIIKCACVMMGLFELPLLGNPILAPVFLIAVSIMVTLVCLLPFLTKPLNAFMRLKWSWLFGKEEKKEEPAA